MEPVVIPILLVDGIYLPHPREGCVCTGLRACHLEAEASFHRFPSKCQLFKASFCCFEGACRF